jgi:WbqC-like protein family
MKLAIMQPYFLPYIGYFHLISAADVFVVYDNIKYTKKGWINRNRLLLNDADAQFSLPLRKGSDSLLVIEREISESFDPVDLLNQFKGAYSRAPYFSCVWPLLEEIITFPQRNLFRYIHHSILTCCEWLALPTRVIVSSTVDIDHSLKSQDKVLSMCKTLQAATYINSMGGVELYEKEVFERRGVDLRFISSNEFRYAQFAESFVPWLSIVDVMMFNPLGVVRERVRDGYTVI